MSKTTIRIENLSKRYRIGLRESKSNTLVGAVADFARSPLRNLRRLIALTRFEADEGADILWALKDVSFETKEGEVIGIIGHNGAGKSTLLKLLSRITYPTSGRIMLNGRAASLLEVGTGFHPELTGRENVYLNGTLLGMSKANVDRCFDEIVDFAGVDRFIDTPIKRYSSGMQVRLAFAVAAHLNPEILLIDEVLSVGDTAFQRKSLGKIKGAIGEGRTVVFVSHNLSIISSLCRRAIWLDHGQIRAQGDSDEIIQMYLKTGLAISNSEVNLIGHPGHRGEYSMMSRLKLLNTTQEGGAVYKSHGTFGFEVEVKLDASILKHCSLGFNIRDSYGASMFSAHLNQYHDYEVSQDGVARFRAWIECLSLMPGQYTLSLFLVSGSVDIDVVEDALTFEVVWDNGLGLAYPPRSGVIYVPVEWAVTEGGDAPNDDIYE